MQEEESRGETWTSTKCTCGQQNDDIRCSEDAAEAKPEPLAGRDMAGLYTPGNRPTRYDMSINRSRPT